MNYRIETKSSGRFFNVPCNVVDKYLKNADGNFIKVLLCLFSYGDEEISDEKISEICGIDPSCVASAIEFWNKTGLIKAESDKKDFVGFEPIVTTNTVSDKTLEIFNEKKKRESTKKYKASEIAQIINNDSDLKVFFDEIQSVIGRGVNYSDQLNFLEIHEDCGYSPAIILLISEYCVSIGKDNSAYIKTTAKDWFNKGIISYEEIEKHIIKLNEYHSYENLVKRAFGIDIRLSKKQQEYANAWSIVGFSQELLEYAYDKCVEKTGKLSFAYIDKILTNLKAKGISTVKDAENESKSFAQKNNAPLEKEHTYDINEIDEFQKNFLLKHLKQD